MTIDCRGNERKTTVFLSGEIDHHGAKNAMLDIGNIINCNMPMLIELDFLNVTFMDSSGIAIIVTTLRRVREYGGRLKLTNVPEQPYKVIKTTALDKLIDINCTEEV